MDLSPIVLFVYNRPWHTRQTVEYLQNNELADKSELIIYSDGFKFYADKPKVKEVRKYIGNLSGFKKIQIIEHTENLGLARSIVNGVTETINRYGRVIVLEDDLLTSRYFLKFANDALKFYENKEKVMHISGYMYPIKPEGLSETFFLRPSSCWGWATWDRAWKYYEKDIDKLYKTFTPKMKKRFNLDGAYNYWSQIKKNKKGKINSWAIFWYASIFVKNGLCLHPSVSMVDNIGHDGSGKHCGRSDNFQTNLTTQPTREFTLDFEENVEALKRLKLFFHSISDHPIHRVSKKIIEKIKKGEEN